MLGALRAAPGRVGELVHRGTGKQHGKNYACICVLLYFPSTSSQYYKQTSDPLKAILTKKNYGRTF